MPDLDLVVGQKEALSAVVYVAREVDGERREATLSITRGECPACARPVLAARAIDAPLLRIDAIRLDESGHLDLVPHACAPPARPESLV